MTRFHAIAAALLSISSLVSAENDALTRALKAHADAVSAARSEYDKKVDAAGKSTIQQIKRLVRSAGPADQAVMYRSILRIDRSDDEARKYFTALNALDGVLAELATESQTQVDALGNPITAFEIPKNDAEWQRLSGKELSLRSSYQGFSLTLQDGQRLRIVPHPTDTWSGATNDPAYPMVNYLGQKADAGKIAVMAMVIYVNGQMQPLDPARVHAGPAQIALGSNGGGLFNGVPRGWDDDQGSIRIKLAPVR